MPNVDLPTPMSTLQTLRSNNCAQILYNPLEMPGEPLTRAASRTDNGVIAAFSSYRVVQNLGTAACRKKQDQWK
jgi:hypothetical protein